MALNFENDGIPLAMIQKGKKMTKHVLSVADKKGEVRHPFDEILLQGDEIFVPICDPKKERSVIYVSGMSGSGKSYFTAEWVRRYKHFFPKNNVFLLSSLDQDDSIDKIKDLYRIRLPEFVEDNWTIDDLKDSCIIFDDTDCISDKTIKKKIDLLLNSVLQTGRHTRTTVIFTSHLPTAGKDTKIILAEAHSVVLFPATMGQRNLKYITEQYFGLSPNEVKKLKKLDSRWVMINRTYPKSILSEKYACLPSLIE